MLMYRVCMGHGKPGKSWNLITAGEHWSLL